MEKDKKVNVEEFVQKQLDLIKLEREAEIEEVETLQEGYSPKELQRLGVALLRLRVVHTRTGLGGRLLVKLEAQKGNDLPTHRFTSGDIVGVSPSGKATAAKHSGVVYTTAAKSVTVAFSKGGEDILSKEDLSGPLDLTQLSNDTTFKRMTNALSEIKTHGPHTGKREENQELLEVLFGMAEPTFSPQPKTPLHFFNSGLNQPQKEAVLFSLASNTLALIHGPPGTGKTTTVVELILQAVKRGERVLVAAPSNIAIDNLVEKLARHARDAKANIVRIGHPARVLPTVMKFSLDSKVRHADQMELANDVREEINKIQITLRNRKKSDSNALRLLHKKLREQRKELKERENKAVKEILKASNVILATTTGCYDKSLREEGLFDLVVIDEAAQAIEASCFIPIIKGRRLVLAGDHKQLPPTILSKEAEKLGLGETLFDRMVNKYGAKVTRKLTIQYRMHEKIMKWSSDEMYEGELIADGSVKSHCLRDLPGVQATPETEAPLVWIDTAGSGAYESQVDSGPVLADKKKEDEDSGKKRRKNPLQSHSKANQGEAELVIKHVRFLMGKGVKPKDIGIISPYNAQVELLRELLRGAQEGGEETTAAIEISSVDGFQGREKEAIIITMVRSNAAHEIGFLSDDRRMNVAVTRARRQAVLIGDSSTISIHPFLKRLVKYFEENALCITPSGYATLLGEDPTFMEYQKADEETNAEVEKIKAEIAERKRQEQKLAENEVSAIKVQTKQEEETLATKDPKVVEREELEKVVLEFLSDEKQREHTFPTTLTSFQRMVVHELAEAHGLQHISIGDAAKNTRCIQISKPHQPSQKSTPSEEVSEENESSEDEEAGEGKPTGTEAKPQSNASKPRPPKKKRKPRKKKPVQSTPTDPVKESILLQQFDTTKCLYKDCRKGIQVLGRVCMFCKMKYCMQHALPEAHGCGAEAKKKAREDWMKEQSSIRTEAQPRTKPLSEGKRKVLQQQLHKKIVAASHGKKGRNQKKGK